MKNLSFIGYDKYCACKSGRIFSLRSGKYLKSIKQDNGYYQVSLSQDGVKNNYLVHRLIAMSYLSNEENKATVNHIDGDKSNNRLSNLEWATQKENIEHAFQTGLSKGVRNQNRSLSDEEAHLICQMIQDDFRNKDISDATGVSRGIIANIRFGVDYLDISSEYDFSKVLPSKRKICVEKLIKICEMLEQGKVYSDIVAEVKCSSATISKIKNRKSGLYISKNYKF